MSSGSSSARPSTWAPTPVCEPYIQYTMRQEWGFPVLQSNSREGALCRTISAAGPVGTGHAQGMLCALHQPQSVMKSCGRACSLLGRLREDAPMALPRMSLAPTVVYHTCPAAILHRFQTLYSLKIQQVLISML